MSNNSTTEQPKRYFSHLRFNVDEMITVFILAMIIRSFLICPFKIPTGSMEPTLHGDMVHGDRIFVIRYPYYFTTPKRGEIIVFKTNNIPFHDGSKDYIKRCIGLPGDKIYIKNGHVYVNDEILDSPEIFKDLKYTYQESSMKYGSPQDPIIVPQKYYFVLGDNSKNSYDGRYWGFVPEKNLKGKAILTFWPIKRFTKLK